jgi:hypothetical protein
MDLDGLSIPVRNIHAPQGDIITTGIPSVSKEMQMTKLVWGHSKTPHRRRSTKGT